MACLWESEIPYHHLLIASQTYWHLQANKMIKEKRDYLVNGINSWNYLVNGLKNNKIILLIIDFLVNQRLSC